MNCAVVRQPELALLVEAVGNYLAARDQTQAPGAAVDSRQGSQAAASRPAQARQGPLPFNDLLEKARDDVISLGNFVAKFESPQDKLIDKKLIVSQFERFEWVQQHGERDLLAYAQQQLTRVLELCEVWPHVMRNPDHSAALVLMQPVDDDCDLVAHLRELLLWLRNLVIAMLEHNRQMDQQAEKNARVDRFFGRHG